MYLEFLSIETVRQYVGDRYKPGTPEYIAALSMVNQTETLLKRPLLLSYISDMVERRNQFLFYHSTPGLAAESGTVTQYELYETILQKWINREKELSAAAGKDYSQLLREVSLQLALSIFYQEGRKNIYYADLKKIVEQQQLPLSEIQLRDRSLLRRNREGYYNFAHRTFKEFFFAQLLYEGRIPEAGFPAAQYEDAEKFYNQMGEVLYFRHNGGPLAAKNIYRPGLITFPPLPESTWPRPVQIFAHLHHIPLGEDASAVYESFLRIAFYQMFIDLGRSFTQEERRQQEAAYRDLLTDVARFLITASEESVSRSYLENLQQENGNAGLIGDLIKLFFFCQSGDRFHFLHRSFAEFLCLRELLDQDEPEVITAFPLHQLRFTRLFANEISWLQLRSRYPGVALLLDNFQLSNEDFRASGFDDWYEYYSSKAGVDYPGFLQRLHQSEGHLCIRADQPLEEDFWRYLPFAGHIKTLDVAHFRLEGGDLRLLTNLQTLCLYGTHSTAVLQLPPGLQHIEVDPASAVPGKRTGWINWPGKVSPCPKW